MVPFHPRTLSLRWFRHAASRYAVNDKPFGWLRHHWLRGPAYLHRVREWLRGMKEPRNRVFQTAGDTAMMRVCRVWCVWGGISSMKACRAGNLLLLVFSLICLTVRFSGLFKMVFLDICRIIHNDCSIQLLIPLSSIRSFGGPMLWCLLVDYGAGNCSCLKRIDKGGVVSRDNG